MNQLRRLALISLLATMALIAGWPDVASAALAKGDPILATNPDELDVPILKQNGVPVGTASGNPIFSVRANQALAAGTVIQHAGSLLFIEVVQISSNVASNVISTASPRSIAAGVDGQTIMLVGTSATNTYTIPTGNGVEWQAASIFFDNFTSRILRYSSALGVWKEANTFTGGSTGLTEFSADITPAQITAAQNNYAPTGLATATVLRLSSDASREITGIVGGSDGRALILRNVGTQNLVLRSENASSTAANRFAFTGDYYTITPNAMGIIQYDVTTSRWYVLSTVINIVPSRTNQARLATESIQHDSRRDAIEIVHVSGNGAAVSITANPRIAAGLDGQTILLQGTSSTNTVTLADGNGIKLASATSITFDDRTSMFFTYDTALAMWRQSVTIGGGGGGGGTAASIAFTPVGTFGSGNLQTLGAEIEAETEKIANRDVNSGYPQLRGDGKLKETQVGSFAQHTGLSNASTITVTARQMGIQGASAAVDFTPGHAQIAAGVANQEVQLIGTDPTFTVKLHNGDSVRLCGNTGSIIVGLNRAKPFFRYNTTLTVWEQLNCESLQDAFNVDNKITTGSTAATGWIAGDFANGNYCSIFWDAANSNIPTMQCFCGGVACPNTIVDNPAFTNSGSKPTCNSTLATSKLPFWVTFGSTTTVEVCKSTGGVFSWQDISSGGGVTDRSVRVRRTTSQSIPDAGTQSDVPITFDAEDFDTDTMHSTSSNTSRIVFTNAGKYQVHCVVRFDVSTGLLDLSIRKNGTTAIVDNRASGDGTNATIFHISTFQSFAAADYVELTVTQTSGGNLDAVVAGGREPACEAYKLY